MSYIIRTVKLRRTHKQFTLKPEVLEMDGKEYMMRVAWVCEPEELYAGEEAWVLAGTGHPVGWLASGDLVPLEEIDWKARALAAEERNQLISMDNFKLTTEVQRLNKVLNELRKIGETWTDQ